jgi:hypothetical protein
MPLRPASVILCRPLPCSKKQSIMRRYCHPTVVADVYHSAAMPFALYWHSQLRVPLPLKPIRGRYCHPFVVLHGMVCKRHLCPPSVIRISQRQIMDPTATNFWTMILLNPQIQFLRCRRLTKHWNCLSEKIGLHQNECHGLGGFNIWFT